MGQGGEDNAFHLQSGKIAPWVMEHTANGQQAEFFVVLADQADLSAAAELADESREGAFRVSAPFSIRLRLLRGQSCNGCVNVGLSTVRSTSLTESW